jgi:NADP-dependent 3-hydroxy acid dehydrogenase YdfG
VVNVGLNNKVTLITEAASGIGESTTLRFTIEFSAKAGTYLLE